MGRVTVIHPDLGVGGAERLIVDASKALQDCGHEVTIYTGYHDTHRCFEETRNGQLHTISVGQWIPRTIFGRFHAVMAYIKMIYIAFYLFFHSSQPDLILCDQVSACIPFLKINSYIRGSRGRIVFYCHFPDQLLTQRDSLMKAIYRKPLDKFEEWSTSLADVILVNSKFTRNVVRRTFPSIFGRELNVLYPCVDVNKFIECKPSKDDCDKIYKKHCDQAKGRFIYLSINRFERKKALTTAIEALSDLIFRQPHPTKGTSGNEKNGVHLIVAGGYDPRLQDSVAYYNELRQLVHDLKLEDYVTFIESPSDEEKLMLLELCDAVIYTPENEHFGIVPLEAMAMSKPVIASASGGPLETIEEGINGLLCARDDDGSFTEAMLKLYDMQKTSAVMGKRGFERVKQRFSYEAFRDHLNKICFPQSDN